LDEFVEDPLKNVDNKNETWVRRAVERIVPFYLLAPDFTLTPEERATATSPVSRRSVAFDVPTTQLSERAQSSQDIVAVKFIWE